MIRPAVTLTTAMLSMMSILIRQPIVGSQRTQSGWRWTGQRLGRRVRPGIDWTRVQLARETKRCVDSGETERDKDDAHQLAVVSERH